MQAGRECAKIPPIMTTKKRENAMRNATKYVPLLALVIAALACQGMSGGGGGIQLDPTSTPAPRVLFEDNFSDTDSGWCVDADDTGALDYNNGEYVFQVFQTDWMIWCNPGRESLSNIHVEVTAMNTGSAADPTFGIICNYIDESQFYYMGIGADGYFAIVKFQGEDDIFLSSDENLWITSDDIELGAASYQLAADCGSDGSLVLYVDGKQIGSANDTSYTGGDVGLFTLSFEETPVEVHFDNLTVTELK